MAVNLTQLREEGMRRIRGAMDPQALFTIEKEFFSRKHGILTLEMQKLGSLPEGERRVSGASLNAVKQALEQALLERKRTLEQAHAQALEEEDSLDLTMDLPAEALRHGAKAGHLHLIPEFLRQVEEVFGRMGFEVVHGPELEEEKYIFDLLNFPKDHPARDVMDTFWLKTDDAKKKHMLRCHLSSLQIRYGEKHKPPFRIVYHGKCYRRDADATHSPMFHQFEAMMVDRNVSLRHLKGIMIAVMKELISPNIDCRFRVSHFPFTEPSMEVDMRWQGDLAKSREGEWMEVAGCGMVHPQVLRNCGIDPRKWQGLAFAFGVERLLMIKHQISDIRLFYEGDLRFLEQF